MELVRTHTGSRAAPRLLIIPDGRGKSRTSGGSEESSAVWAYRRMRGKNYSQQKRRGHLRKLRRALSL